MFVATIDGIKIYLYPKDHSPPHFHAMFAEYEVLIEIRTLQIMRGALPGKQVKKVLQWAEGKQDRLLMEFERLQQSR